MNVIVVTKKAFYKDFYGNERAMAVDYSDIHTFSNMDKAEDFVQQQIEMEKEFSQFGCPPYEKYVYEDTLIRKSNGYKAYIVYAQNEYNTNGIRYGYMISKQVVK